MSDTSYMKKPISEWPTDEIRRWMNGIEMRSDSVISKAMDSDDWTDHDADEKLHAELFAELKRRGELRTS